MVTPFLGNDEPALFPLHEVISPRLATRHKASDKTFFILIFLLYFEKQNLFIYKLSNRNFDLSRKKTSGLSQAFPLASI